MITRKCQSCPCTPVSDVSSLYTAAKKSRQKKAAHTASPCIRLRDPNRSYASHGNVPAGARCQRFEPMPHPLRTPVFRQAAANRMCRPGGKLCVGRRTVPVSALPEHQSCFTVRSDAPMARKPTHSLPPGRRRTIWHGVPRLRSVKWVMRIERTLATNAQSYAAVWSVRPFGGPQAGTRIGGVSRFLLPTFLCGGKEK